MYCSVCNFINKTGEISVQSVKWDQILKPPIITDYLFPWAENSCMQVGSIHPAFFPPLGTKLDQPQRGSHLSPPEQQNQLPRYNLTTNKCLMNIFGRRCAPNPRHQGHRFNLPNSVKDAIFFLTFHFCATPRLKDSEIGVLHK